MKTCPGCSRSVADIIGQCPFCRHVFPAVEGARPMLDPELISAAIAAEREGKIGRSGLFQTMLLLLALPVLVPSLIFFWIGAKRWGRVDWLLLTSTGAVLTLGAIGSPMALALMLIADACAAALFVLRYSRLDHGIFLGYSNAVAYPLILGGLVAGFGAFVYLPIGPLNQLSQLYSMTQSVTPAELASDDPPAHPRAVSLTGAKLARSSAWVERRTPTGTELVPAIPTGIVAVADPCALWERRAELAGRHVRLTAPGVTHTFPRSSLAFARAPGGPKDTDAQPRVHGVLPGCAARVWIASGASSPGDDSAEQLKAGGERIGYLVLADTDPETARAWGATGRREPLPGTVALVVPGEPDPQPADLGLPAYVPVEGTGNRLWVHFPGGRPLADPVEISGIFDRGHPRLQRLEQQVAKPGEPIAGGLRLLRVTTRAEFADATGLSDACAPRELGTALVAMGIGAFFALAGLVASLRE